jgi:DNA-binding SARP family transcriptional activator
VIEYRVLGPLEVHGENGPLPLGGAKQRALLALLLLNANRIVSRERLIDDLWGDEPPETAVTMVQIYVSRLRKVLPAGGLLTRAPGYLLAAEPETIDLQRFEQLLAGGRKALAAGDSERASRSLRKALELWRGPPLAEFSEPFARAEGSRLEDLHLSALEERLEADLGRGRENVMVAELEALVAEYPHRERLRAQLMVALYRSGRQAEALASYRDARAALEELGIEPSEQLRKLERAILNQDLTLLAPPPLIGGEITLPGQLRVSSPFPFVGRDDELGHLRSLLQRVEDGGGGQVALVGGEAGSGKTRLVRELAREAAADGTLVLYGSCDPVYTAPYQPFVNALDYLVRVADPTALTDCLGDGRGELARLLPELGSPSAPAADPETERLRVDTAVLGLLARVSRQRPLLVVIDDIHWADASSVHLLLHLARAIAGANLLLLATHRDRSEDERPEFVDALAGLARIDGLTRVAVSGLSDGDVAELIRQLTGASDAGAIATLAADVRSLTDGIPFFLCELWRLLGDAELIEISDGAPRLTRPLAEVGSPDSVRDVVHYRLSRLAPRSTAMLELAAVIGGQFELRLLQEALQTDALASSVDEALHSGTIEEIPGTDLSYRFAHEIVRRALYDRLSGIRRAELHLHVGEALERVYHDDERLVPELARHFTAAAPLGGVERAVSYNLRAAAQATATFSYEEAARRLTTARKLGIADERVRGRAELDLARALWITGDPEPAAAVLDDALESALAAGDEQNEWYVRLERAGVRRDRDPDKLATLARSAAEVFARLDDDLGLARAQRRIALAASERCAFGEAARECEVALAHAIEAGDGQEETRIVDALCTALLYGPQPAGDGIARCRELLERAVNPMTRAVILSSLAGLEAMTGRVDAARAAYRTAGAIYSELELPFFLAGLSSISGPIELLAGNPVGAARMLRTGIQLLGDQAGGDAVAYRSALLALALVAKGNRDEAVRALGAATPVRLMTRIAHAIAAARTYGDASIARDAVELSDATDAINVRAEAHATLADLLASHGGDAEAHRELALVLYEEKGNELAARGLSDSSPVEVANRGRGVRDGRGRRSRADGG